jgi:hypothetical protein
MGYVARAVRRDDIRKGRKRPIVRPRNIWEDNIGTDLREILLEAVDWIHLAQSMDRLRAAVHTVMYLRLPCKRGNFLAS